MKTENTHYGLKNHLKIEALEKKSTNHYQFKLLNYKSTNNSRVFLNILALSESLIRFNYSYSEEFNLWINPHLELQNFDFQNTDFIKETYEDDRFIELKTEKLSIKILKSPLAISLSETSSAELLSEDVPELGFYSVDLGEEIRTYKKYKLENPPRIYGLGDKTGKINHWGKRFRNEPLDALGYDGSKTDPLYKDIPFFMVMNESGTAHGIFFDNFSPKFFDFGKERKPCPYYYWGAKSGEMNYYFFYGPKLKTILKNYLKLTGMPALMPECALGYLASGMAYTESENSSEYILRTIDRLSSKKLSMTAFHLSSGYTLDENHKRLQFQWNAKRFPDPLSFAKSCDDRGVKLAANLKPVLLKEHPDYKEADEQAYFIKDHDGNSLLVDYWGGEGSYIDFLNPEAQSWWKSKIKSCLLEKGVYGIWNDNNEYEIFEKNNRENQLAQMSLVMSRLAYEASREHDIKTPWILSRSAYSGIQKYAQTWTGDNYSSWNSLKYDIALTNSMCLSGLVHTGSDIGGFWGPEPDYELLTRWIQQGVFSPRFSIHSYKKLPTEADLNEKAHPESFEIIKKFMELRSELMPYLMAANRKAHEEGSPIQRPLVYDFQNDPKTWDRSFEYMFGEELLVAPVYEAAAKSRKLYLPKGCMWKDYWDGSIYLGGIDLERPVDLGIIPIFRRL
jgi:alpha-glucosidase